MSETKASTALRSWIERARCSQVELAQRIGCKKSFASHLVNGRRKPGLEMAARIEELTGIQLRDWFTAAPRSAGGSTRRAA